MRIVLLLIAVSMSGCTSAELAVDMYQMCKYRDKCPVELVGNWLKKGQVMLLFAVIGLIILSRNQDLMICVSGCG